MSSTIPASAAGAQVLRVFDRLGIAARRAFIIIAGAHDIERALKGWRKLSS